MIELADLPAPPPGKTGWPWNESRHSLPPQMPSGQDWPQITIVTPSYNQGEFLEETIRSVLLQGYPNLEYIIIDGGSQDESLAVIQKYAQFLSHWVSEPDRGQAHAINKGFDRGSGAIFNWINSDDFFGPNVLAQVATGFSQSQDVEVLYGNCFFTDAAGQPEQLYGTQDFSLPGLLARNFIGQPTVFFKQRLWQDYGHIKEDLHFIVDYELWLRWALEQVRFCHVAEIVAYYRMHDASKSYNLIRTNQNESATLFTQLTQSGQISAELQPYVKAHLYGFCVWNYARLDLKQFWVTFIQYLQYSRSLPNLSLLRKATMSLLGENTLKFLRRQKYGKSTVLDI